MSEKYVPKLHPNMPEWKKILYYNHHVTAQYPRLDNKPVDMTTSEYKTVAIRHVNDLLEAEKIAYQKRVKRREEREQQKRLEEQQKRMKDLEYQKSHVKEMEKKYGWDWYRDVADTDEDCKEAFILREEEEREDEIAYWEDLRETQERFKQIEEEFERQDHKDAFFDTMMQIEITRIKPEIRSVYIQTRYNKIQQEKMERDFQSDAEFEAEGDAWYSSMENAKKHRVHKKMRIAAYLAQKS
jgi:hypothetical protein